MFIELTDVLRCPADHPEAYLILLPDRVEDRTVRSGQLGCPVCGLEYRIDRGIAGFGDPPDLQQRPSALDAEGLHALIGVDSPGGYVALVGTVAAEGAPLAAHLEGVHLIAVNPPESVAGDRPLSVLLGDRLPLKAGSVRGVILGPGYGDSPFWRTEAQRVVLPGLRVVGEGTAPAPEDWESLGTAGAVWVARPV